MPQWIVTRFIGYMYQQLMNTVNIYCLFYSTSFNDFHYQVVTLF